MAKAPAVPVEQVVRNAVVRLATEGEVRLTGKGDPPPLFASKTGANKPTLDRLLAGDRPLIEVRAEGKAEYARLTPAGFLAALPALPADRVAELATRLAVGLTTADRLAFLLEVSRTATGDVSTVLSQAVAALTAEAEMEVAAAARRRAAEAEILRQLAEFRRSEVARLRVRLADAEHSLRQLDPSAGDDAPPPPPTSRPTVTSGPKPGSHPLLPDDPADLPFRREVLRRLAASWLEAIDQERDEGRRYLEAALANISGVRRIGRAGEQVPFDGAAHRADRGVADGQPVRVVRSGWELDEDGSPYLILPAEVE